jgi:hypothetical protein
MKRLKSLYKNWTVHNLISHPLSELVYILSFGKLEKLCNKIHDFSIPENPENGRG